jgi:hypothetical protein
MLLRGFATPPNAAENSFDILHAAFGSLLWRQKVLMRAVVYGRVPQGYHANTVQYTA